MFEFSKYKIRAYIRDNREVIRTVYGWDANHWEYDPEANFGEGALRRIDRSKKSKILRLFFQIWLFFHYLWLITIYTGATFYWFKARVKGYLHEEQKMDPDARSYLFHTIVVIPGWFYIFNVYL